MKKIRDTIKIVRYTTDCIWTSVVYVDMFKVCILLKQKEQNCFQSNIAKYLINNATVSLFDNFVTSITVYCTFCCISYHNNTVSLDCITSTYWIRAFVWWYRRWPDSQPLRMKENWSYPNVQFSYVVFLKMTIFSHDKYIILKIKGFVYLTVTVSEYFISGSIMTVIYLLEIISLLCIVP